MMNFEDIIISFRIVVTIMLAWTLAEIFDAIGIDYTLGYVLYVPIFFIMCVVSDSKIMQKNIFPKRNTVSIMSRIAKTWYLYLTPALAILVACVHFRGYTIYKILRVFVACQSAFYVALFYSTNSNRRILLLACFLVLAIIFFPVFRITMRRDMWQLIDFFFAALAIYTNLTIYDDDK